MSKATLELFLGRDFGAGLAAGAIGALLGGLIGLVWRRQRESAAPVAGMLGTGAALFALDWSDHLPAQLWPGVIVLLVAGALSGRGGRMARIVAGIGSALAAWMVADASGVTQPGWMHWFAVLAIVVLSPIVSRADRSLSTSALGPSLFGLSVIGVLFAVPDTESAIVLVGAYVPIAALGWPLQLGSFGSSGAYGSTGILMWAILSGGYGRPGSVVGATLCLGMLLVIPVTGAAADRGGRLGRVVMLLGAHLVLVAIASRVVSTPQSPVPAVLAAIALLMVTSAWWYWLVSRQLPERTE